MRVSSFRSIATVMCGLLVALAVATADAQGPPRGGRGQGGPGGGRGGFGRMGGGGGFGRMGGGRRGFMNGGGSAGLVRLLGIEQVQKEIKMTEEQKTKLKEMQEAAWKEIQKMMEEFRGLSREERQKRFEESQDKMKEEAAKREKEATTKLAELLTPEQLKRVKQIQLQQAGVMVLSWPVVEEELGLTAEQKEQLKKIGEDARKKMSELMPQRRWQRGGDNRDDADREEMRKQMQEMRQKMQEMRKEIEKKSMDVLTADQKAKLGQMMGEPFKLDRSAMRGNWGGRRGEGRRGQGRRGQGRRGQGRRGQGQPSGGQPGGDGPGEPI